MVKDPVCGMEVDEKTTKLTSRYKGISYAFCSESCKTGFEKDPDKILGDQNENPQGKHKSVCCSHDSAQPHGCCSGEETKSPPTKSSCC